MQRKHISRIHVYEYHQPATTQLMIDIKHQPNRVLVDVKRQTSTALRCHMQLIIYKIKYENVPRFWKRDCHEHPSPYSFANTKISDGNKRIITAVLNHHKLNIPKTVDKTIQITYSQSHDMRYIYIYLYKYILPKCVFGQSA